MIYLLDTNAVADLMRGHPKLASRVGALAAGDRLYIPVTVRGELLFGLNRLKPGARRTQLQQQMARAFAAASSMEIPEAAAEAYARIKLDRQQRGVSMDENDLWIAATALANGGAVVTRDADFKDVAGLHVEDWTQ